MNTGMHWPVSGLRVEGIPDNEHGCCDCDCDPFLFFMVMKTRQQVAGCLRAPTQDTNNNGAEALEYSSNKPFSIAIVVPWYSTVVAIPRFKPPAGILGDS